MDADYDFENSKSQTSSVRQKKKISINDYATNTKTKGKVNSPRSLKAMSKLGYGPNELKYQTFKEYCQSNLNLQGKSQDEKKAIYNKVENLRQEKINSIQKERENIIQNGDTTSRPRSSYNNSKSSIKINCTELENQKRAFERMKNKNEMDLRSMIQYEISRELIRKKGEEKVKEQQLKAEKHQRELMKKRREEEEMRNEKQRQKEQKQREMEEMQQRMNLERYEAEIKKAKEAEIRERKRMKEAAEKAKEDERKRIEFQQKVDSMLEVNRRKNQERMEIMNQKEEERKRKIEEKNRKRIEENNEKTAMKRERIENVQKKMELEKEKIREEFLEKQRKNDEKKQRFDKQKLNEAKKRQEEGLKKAEEIRQIIESKNEIIQRRVDEYNKKQNQIALKKMEKEEILKEEQEKKNRMNQEKEERSKNIRLKNEELIQNRKEEILAKIKRNEENTNQVKKEKAMMNKKIMEENIEKRIHKEYQIQQVAAEQQNKRDQYMNEINEKTYKINEFKKQKEILNEQKKILTDDMARRKQEYSDKFQKIFGSNNFNERTIRNIQQMFPGDKKINELLNDYYSAFDKEGENNKTEELKTARTNKSRSFYQPPKSAQIRGYSARNTKQNQPPYKLTKGTSFHYEDNTFSNVNTSGHYKSNYTGNNNGTISENNYYKSYLPSTDYQSRPKSNKPQSNYYNEPMRNTKQGGKCGGYFDYSNNILAEDDNKERIKKYKQSLNKEMLDILSKEKQKEAIRERQLESLGVNDPRRKGLEDQFGRERAQANLMLQRKNE
ncbi:MAG: hypothetical protein MJ252_11045 [archaeon]|nr:hypothetical protein [archaeon]